MKFLIGLTAHALYWIGCMTIGPVFPRLSLVGVFAGVPLVGFAFAWGGFWFGIGAVAALVGFIAYWFVFIRGSYDRLIERIAIEIQSQLRSEDDDQPRQ